MANRQTRGRQRIPISRIQNQDDLYATFSKRSRGLYKKASELSTLCGVDVGVIIYSPTNVPYSFFHPTMECVINRYINPNQPQDDYTRMVESATRSRIDSLNRRLDEILEALEEQNKYPGERGWWEEPMESLSREAVKERIEWFQGFKAEMESRIEQLKNGTQNPEIFFPPAFDQFPTNAQDPSYANETGPFSSQYFLPDDTSFYNYVSQDPSNSLFSSIDGESGQVPSHHMYPQPPSAQVFNSLDLSTGGSNLSPSHFFFSLDPSTATARGSGLAGSVDQRRGN